MASSLEERIEPLKKEFDAIVTAEKRKLDRDLPRVLYHYTTVHGLMGIMASGKLRVSNILYMNDASELDHGRRLFQKVLDELRSDPNELRGISSSLEGFLIRRNSICAFSMSEKEDDLPQWNAYSGGLGGFAIGFDVRSDVDVQVDKCSLGGVKELFVNIVYDPDEPKLAREALVGYLRRYNFREPITDIRASTIPLRF